MCAHQLRVGALRVPAGRSRASPATRLQYHLAAIPGTTGDASRGSPVGSGALALPLPRFKNALRGAGSSYLAAAPGRAGRGAAAALGCDPGGFTSGSRFAGAGREGLGWGGQGRYPWAGGVWRSGPLGCHATHAFLRLPSAPRLHSAVPRSVACPQRPPPRRGCRPPRGAGWRGRQEGRTVKPQARG